MDWVGCSINLLIWGGMDLDPTLRGGMELGLKMCPVKTSSLDCTDIVSMFPLSVPGRRTRRPELFHVPTGSGRVDSVKRGFLVRIPQLLNSLVQSSPRTDFFLPSRYLRSDIATFANNQGTYI